MTFTEIITISFLMVLFIFTVISQFQNSWVDKIRQRDLFNFLPAWYFFAPRPVTYHLYLFYRDEYEDGSFTAWKRVLFSEKRKWWHFIWNPKKRLNKAFFDIFKDLMDHIKISSEPEFLVGSIPYLLLLTFINKMEHAPFALRTQFAVFKQEADAKDAELLFLSFVHDLEEEEIIENQLTIYA
ncbi:hypothetical protein [Polluticaenibacter yanchengensis]|uniref:Uncharacterized protein n=1 Tax=Polluticaenibacter yanchengensis TaxID=3014562 RepID=A0ABT4ULG8_9BACT|nr:hypothetical protein [Chitinophagaceae bacterium LY-5]